MTGGLLSCRIRAFEGDLVEFETIYHRDHGSEPIGKPSRLPLDGFLELSFGRWDEGSSPPPAVPTRGLRRIEELFRRGVLDPGGRALDQTLVAQPRLVLRPARVNRY